MSNRRQHFDVVIAGGGVIGCSIAYALSRSRALSVAVVDKKKPGNATRASAGGLWPVAEAVGTGCEVIIFRAYCERMAKDPGASSIPQWPHKAPDFFVDLTLRSTAMYPALADELRAEHGLDIKLIRSGLKFLAFDETDRRFTEHLVESNPRLRQYMHWIDADELHREEPHVAKAALGALVFTVDDHVNPFALLECYREAAQRNGVTFLSDTEVKAVEMKGGRVEAIRTDAGMLGCDLLINAAGAWASDLTQMVLGRPIPVMPVKGQVVLTERLPPIMRSSLSATDCYIVQKDNGELFIGSTFEDKGYDTTITEAEIRGLCAGALKCIPMLENVNIKRTWAGLRPGTPDDLPILGPVRGIEGYLNACGHSRLGITTAAVTSEIIAALAHGKPPPVDITPYLLDRYDREEAWQHSMIFTGSVEPRRISCKDVGAAAAAQ